MGRLTKEFEFGLGHTECYEACGMCLTVECGSFCTGLQEMLKKLAHYEDLEEQGLLHKAQLKNGTPIYVLQWDYWNGDYDMREECYLYGMTEFLIGEINKDWWLTKEEDESKLAELKGE